MCAIIKSIKYFTMKWWLAFQGDMPKKEQRRPQKEYDLCYASVKKQLPKQFVDFDKSYSLHDATLLKLRFNAEKQQLKIKVILAIVHEKFIEGRNGTLTYSGVTNFSISKPAEHSPASSDNYAFLLADEIEVISPDVFEHKILFSSGVEFDITFTYFNFSIDD